eukprot:PLAT13716.1.p1 GENE.PLAT13716.1~~PLAT13716.1.p1  ORF type:complete len:492 (+),score=160.51 PLAT13716.1:99-1478(+)
MTDGLRLPGGREMLSTDGEVRAAEEGVDVTPKPGFVIKTVDDSGLKTFINICVSSKVRKPSTTIRKGPDGEDQEGLSVPLSVGPPRPGEDKAGKACVVYDVIVSPTVVKQSKQDKTGGYRHWIVEIALNYVGEKYSVTLDPRYKLPKMRYKGEPVPQRIRFSQMAGIEDMDDVDEDDNAAASSTRRKAKSVAPSERLAAAVQKRPEPLQAIMHMTKAVMVDGGDLQAVPEDKDALPWELHLFFDLALLRTADSVDLQLAADYLTLQADGYKKLELMLPFSVDVNSASSTFDAAGRQLLLVLRVDRADPDTGRPDPGSRPWLLMQALHDSGSPTHSSSRDSSAGESKDDSIAKAAAKAAAAASDVLPEDRFHAKDVMSQHIISQRQAAAAEKASKKEAVPPGHMMLESADGKKELTDLRKLAGKPSDEEAAAAAAAEEAAAKEAESAALAEEDLVFKLLE